MQHVRQTKHTYEGKMDSLLALPFKKKQTKYKVHNSNGSLTPTLGGAACIRASEYIRTSWCIRARAWDFKPMGASVNHLKFLELDDMGEDQLQFHFSSNMLICSNSVSDKTNKLEWGLDESEKTNLFFKLTHSTGCGR